MINESIASFIIFFSNKMKEFYFMPQHFVIKHKFFLKNILFKFKTSNIFQLHTFVYICIYKINTNRYMWIRNNTINLLLNIQWNKIYVSQCLLVIPPLWFEYTKSTLHRKLTSNMFKNEYYNMAWLNKACVKSQANAINYCWEICEENLFENLG